MVHAIVVSVMLVATPIATHCQLARRVNIPGIC